MANIAANGSPDDANTYVAYKYLGALMVVDASHPAVPNGLKLTYAGVTSGDYSGFDRFGRVAWQRWLRSSGSVAADRYFYGYGRAGNRKWRAERSDPSYGDGKRDEAYVYDKLDRLVGAKRGILASGAYQAPYPGDVNLSGVVNSDDYTAMYLNWLQSGKTWIQGDLNGDGKVAPSDYVIYSLNQQANPDESVSNSLYVQAAKLYASDGKTLDVFGQAVALDGDLAVIGARLADSNSVSNSGAAYVFHKGDDGWRQVARLEPDDPGENDYFGNAVAISGDTVVVGDCEDDANGANSGSAYVFERKSGKAWQWEQKAKLTASDSGAGQYFGCAVSISGSRIVIGAYGHDSSKGAAYVFEHSGANGWQEKCKLPSGGLSPGDYFGYSVALDGNTAVAGAYGDDDANTNAGAAYVFRYSGTSWSLEQTLTADDGEAADYFGKSVAISGDKIVACASGDDCDGNSNVGSAYVFSRSGSTWTQQKHLKASDGAANDIFGSSWPGGVSIDGNTVLVGAYGDDDKGTSSGSAYVFGDPNLCQTAKLTATDGQASDFLGRAVSFRGNTAIVGAHGDDDKGNYAGAAYVFRGADLGLSQSWSLSPTGNWTSSTTNGATQTRTHNNANEILTISGAITPLYDEAGNNVYGPKPADQTKAMHCRYDAWNRLAKIYWDDGDTAGTLDANDTLRATYRYDGLNRRVRKVVVGDDANTTTQHMYHNEGLGLRSLGEAGWQIVEVRRGVNAAPSAAAYKQYAWDLRYIDAPICRWWDDDGDGQMEPAAGEMQYFTNDGNFNTTALVDANTGSVVERYLYDPYGRPTFLSGSWGSRSASAYDNEILYCGYRHDAATGLYHVRNRYYNWLTGRWMTTDPGGYVDGVNLYEYVRCNPSTVLDPWGLFVFISTMPEYMPRPWFDPVPWGGAGSVALPKPASSPWFPPVSIPVPPAGVRPAMPDSSVVPKPAAKPLNPGDVMEKEHTRARPSTENKHEEGQARQARDKGGEKGDARRGDQGPEGEKTQDDLNRWKSGIEKWADSLKPLERHSLEKWKNHPLWRLYEHAKRLGYDGPPPPTPPGNMSIIVSDVRVVICGKGFHECVFGRGDTCWCKWESRTNKSIDWPTAQAECAKTAISGNAGNIKEGETICVPD